MNIESDSIRAGIGALCLHLVLALALIFGVSLRDASPLIAANIIEGVVIDSANFDVKPIPDAVELPPEPVVETIEPVEEPDDSLAKEQEQQRLAEEQLKLEQAEEAARLEVQQQRQAEEERIAEAERAAKIEREKQQKQAAEKKRAEQEAAKKKRQAEAARKKKLAEQKAAAERARKAQQARDRQQDAESALQEQLAAEERRRSAVNAGLLEQYKLRIKQKIQRNWRPPPLAGPVTCELRVRQLRTGDVINVEGVDCGGNSALERSLEAAAYKASPFPAPEDESLFDHNLVFRFESDE